MEIGLKALADALLPATSILILTVSGLKVLGLVLAQGPVSRLTVNNPSYFADCKNYSENSGLKFWVTNANKYPLLAPLAQDLLSAPASEAYVERVFSVCGELTAGKRNRLIKSFEKRIMPKMNLKYCA